MPNVYFSFCLVFSRECRDVNPDETRKHGFVQIVDEMPPGLRHSVSGQTLLRWQAVALKRMDITCENGGLPYYLIRVGDHAGAAQPSPDRWLS